MAEFNQRLRQAGEDANIVFFKYAEPRWLPRKSDSRIYNEFFVAVDNGVVRGGYALKTQDFLFPDGCDSSDRLLPSSALGRHRKQGARDRGNAPACAMR